MSLWEDLKHNKIALLLIAGEKDDKFKKIAHSMCSKLGEDAAYIEDGSDKHPYTIVAVPNCGHVVHIEKPLHVIYSIRNFVTRLEVFSS